MVHSVGKKLQQARLSKQLSVEEAARVTRIRPDKLIDLEEDNYSNFPSMSYAKGFLMLYARFLGVDVRDFADSLHTPNPVSSDDYEYLNAAAAGPQPMPARRPYHPTARRERSIVPVIVFGVLAACVMLAVYLVVSFQRLGNLEDLTEKKDVSSPAESPAISTVPAPPAPPAPAPVQATPAPVVVARSTPPPPAVAAATPAPPKPTPPVTASAVAASSPAAAATPPPAVPAGTFDPTREVRRAEPVFPTPPDHAAASPPLLPPVGAGPAISSIVPADSPDPIRNVTIRPIRKTWVTIRKDVPDSPPIFEDFLYPGDIPLKLSGHKFWIKVEDPTAVEVTRDGQPVTGGQSEIEIE
jgi:cytoskeletal protein RodZ